MRVLFAASHLPEEPSRSISGAFQRMRMWLDATQSDGSALELLVFTPQSADTSPAHAARVARALADEWGIRAEVVLCAREPSGQVPASVPGFLRPMLTLSEHTNFGAFAGQRQRDALAAALARSPDVVFFHGLHPATIRWSRPAHTRVLLDLPDIEHRRLMREISQPPRRKLKPLRWLWMPSVWWAERSAIARTDRTYVCSDIDRVYLERSMGVHNVGVIPNATAHVQDHPPSAEPNVLFVGTYDYAPNRVAADFLVREIWPVLSRLRPEAKLLIAGPFPEQLADHAAPPAGVQFLGFVPDLNALYARTSVFCCPIQSGGGTRIKILEAANHGVPVVSTPVGAEGIAFAPDREILLRSTAAEIASACAELLADPGRARSLGEQGRDRVRALYGRERIVQRMRAALAGEAPAL